MSTRLSIMFKISCLLLFRLVISLSKAQLDDDLIVTLNEPNSKIRGHILKSNNGNDFYAFQSIPYADPPIGELRFKEARPHPGWDGILNTTTSDKICMQDGRGTEDCLIVNVFTPVKPGKGKLPVYVWIHGGAFIMGACNLERCGPKYLMDYGIILVSIHYRLGAFGFLSTEDGVLPGNIGLKDQIFALKWLNKNIAAFGGDPSQVTIGGESAGSISVSSIVVSQKATGLYRAAIMESGTALIEHTLVSNPRYYAFQLGRLIDSNFKSNSSEELLKLLLATEAEKIVEASSKIESLFKPIGMISERIFGLVLENKEVNPMLKIPIHQSFMEGKFDKVPILIGFNSEEILLFSKGTENVKKLASLSDANDDYVISHKWHIPDQNKTIASKELKEIYTNTTFLKELASFVHFSSDVSFINSIMRQAALSADHVPVYLYQFSYEGATHRQFLNITGSDGVSHGEEQVYLFPMSNLITAEDKAMSRVVLTMWSNFIKTLNPSINRTDPDLVNVIWPKVTNKMDLEYLNIDKELSIQKSPKHYKEVAAWYDKFARPPYIVF